MMCVPGDRSCRRSSFFDQSGFSAPDTLCGERARRRYKSGSYAAEDDRADWMRVRPCDASKRSSSQQLPAR